ncbi:MAG: two-component system response regulator [Phormidesmis sp.]
MTKILVIEDETEIRSNLIELLKLEEYEVMGADSGVTGLIGAMEYQPDLILCDVMMPELDGYDVLSALRQDPKTALIPFVFLTAFADRGDIRQGMELGADDYLTKPFTCSEVIGAVETRLKKQALIEEDYRLNQAQVLAKQRQQARQFRDGLDQADVKLMDDVRQELKRTVTSLTIVTNALRSLPESLERNQGLSLIQSVCAGEIKLLARIPNFEYLENEHLLNS